MATRGEGKGAGSGDSNGDGGAPFPGPHGQPDHELQFDKVELPVADAGRTCRACFRRIDDRYYELAGQVVCDGCADKLAGTSGGAARFARAAAFGVAAALLGSVVWYAIVKATDHEFGLLAIGVGLLVGFAVKKGVRGRGGWRAQTLAMALTYLSITGAQVPFIVQAVIARNASSDGGRATGAPAAGDAVTTAAPAPVSAAASGADEPAAPASPPSAGGVAYAMLMLIGLAMASPFLAGFDNIMGIIIIGIGLYEAWKINRRVLMSGPFRIGPEPASLPAEPAPISALP